MGEHLEKVAHDEIDKVKSRLKEKRDVSKHEIDHQCALAKN